MITSPAFAGKKYAVLGLARSGLATVDALVASGAEVVAWDKNEDARAKFLPGTGRGTARSAVEGLALSPEQPLHQPAADGQVRIAPRSEAMPGGHGDLSIPPRAGEELVRLADPLEIDLTNFAGVVVSPGVPLNRHPIAGHAAKYGVPVIGDIELFAQARADLPPHKVVGITGTNGKSTTTALVHHILETAGVPTTMGGNIGLPILGQDPLPEGGVYVLELSSYQIDLTYSLDCDVAVLLNITPDHLDRYDGFEGYAASKARLFAMQDSRHLAVMVGDGGIVSSIAEDAEPTHEYSMIETDPLARLRSAEGKLGTQTDWPLLQGPHNLENAAAAYETCLRLGLTKATIAEGLRTYPGLPHRMERVREKDGVLFVNDSKATNPDSAAPALAAYPHVHWIVGGLAKTEDLGPCEAQLGHVRAAYTIGEAGPMFARLLEGRVPVTQSELLVTAVKDAAAAARPGEVVLLSPACASFDQFRDYEARGQAFRDAVGALGE